MAYRKILVPIDGSTTSQKGLRAALGMAKEANARMLLVHVLEERSLFTNPEASPFLGQMMDDMRRSGEQLLAKAEASVRKQGVQVRSVLVETPLGSAADGVLRTANQWHPDVIVVGTHGRRGLRRIVMGSDAEEIVRGARAPVMLIRAQGSERPQRRRRSRTR